MRWRPHKSSKGQRPRWPRWISARVGGGDARFTDEDILQTLQAGASGVRVGDLCAAADIPVETYYRWKVKYGGITLPELSRRRLRERRYRHAGAALLAAVVLAIGYVAVVRFGIPVVQRPPVSVPKASTQPRPAPVRTSGSPALERKPQATAPAGATSRGAAPAANAWRGATLPAANASRGATAPAASTSQGRRDDQRVEIGARGTVVDIQDVRTTDPEGYVVQVAAVSTLQGAREMLARLVTAGYSAYLTRTTAGQAEMYRIRVGPFESRALAEEAVRRLEADGHRGAWIAK
jgi:hypothetical protein